MSDENKEGADKSGCICDDGFGMNLSCPVHRKKEPPSATTHVLQNALIRELIERRAHDLWGAFSAAANAKTMEECIEIETQRILSEHDGIQGAAPVTPKSEVPTIDLEASSWEQIKQAAKESPWIPPEYFQNDWVSDVCAFLREPESVSSPAGSSTKEEKALGNEAPTTDVNADHATPQNALRCDLCSLPATHRSDTFLYCDEHAPAVSEVIEAPGPMENLLDGLDEQSGALSLAELDAELAARGIDAAACVAQVERLLSEHVAESDDASFKPNPTSP